MTEIKNLTYQRKNVWEEINDEEKNEIYAFAEGYKEFLNKSKTERESVQFCVDYAKSRGFKELVETAKLALGDKVFAVKHDKAVIMAVIGEKPLEEGLNIIGSHIDSPRLDLKPQTIYEKDGLSLLKTHYYGGIKKYQWTSVPLALHGTVIKGDGSKINIVIGEKDSDPVFTITDLLPHLAKDQMSKKLSEAVPGESLNILCGGLPVVEQDVKEKVKGAVLEYLYSVYGIVEEDFISAEIEAVPAWPARDVGFDRSLVGSYGQDDRVCAYVSLKSITNLKTPKYTSVIILADKEEIGSSGNTGMMSSFFENTIAELVARSEKAYSDLILRRSLANSRALSADVNAGLDPNFEKVMEKMNAGHIGCGVVITKYTGSRGKNSSNDAHAEFMGYIRQIFNKNKVVWQTGELGKVDQGGGGTIAFLMAALGMNVVDCGVALLGMHSTFEIAAKADIYMAYKGYHAFLAN